MLLPVITIMSRRSMRPLAVEQIGQPRDRLEGVAERVAGLALAARLIVDPAACDRGLEIEGTPARHRRSENHAAIPGVLGHEGEGVERLVVGIAVLDQLEGGQAGGDFAGHRRARPGPAARRQVIGETHRHLELDCPDGGRRRDRRASADGCTTVEKMAPAAG